MRKSIRQFVGPRRIGYPRAVSGERLGTGMNDGTEFRDRLGSVHGDQVIVAEEIRSANSISVVDVVIDLPDRVVGVIHIRACASNDVGVRSRLRIRAIKLQQVVAQRVNVPWAADCRNGVRDAAGRVTVRHCRWYADRDGVAHGVPLPLVSAEKEKFIRDNAAANGSTKLLQLHGSLWCAYGIEIVARIE